MDWKGFVIKELLHCCDSILKGLRKTTTSITVASVQADNRSRRLLNASLYLYR